MNSFEALMLAFFCLGVLTFSIWKAFSFEDDEKIDTKKLDKEIEELKKKRERLLKQL